MSCRLKSVSTNPAVNERLEALKDGVFCYVHLWAALKKHVQIDHAEIEPYIGLWDDHQGSFFAAFNQGNKRTLQLNASYVCAIGEEGPAVGQLDKIPPCTPVQIPEAVLILLNALAKNGAQSTEAAINQIGVLAMMIDKTLPLDKKRIKSVN